MIYIQSLEKLVKYFKKFLKMYEVIDFQLNGVLPKQNLDFHMINMLG